MPATFALSAETDDSAALSRVKISALQAAQVRSRNRQIFRELRFACGNTDEAQLDNRAGRE
jgi:hypothetical protein